MTSVKDIIIRFADGESITLSSRSRYVNGFLYYNEIKDFIIKNTGKKSFTLIDKDGVDIPEGGMVYSLDIVCIFKPDQCVKCMEYTETNDNNLCRFCSDYYTPYYIMRSSIDWWEQHITQIPQMFKEDDYGSDKFELICKFSRFCGKRYFKYYWCDDSYCSGEGTMYFIKLDSTDLDTLNIHLIKDGEDSHLSSDDETDDETD